MRAVVWFRRDLRVRDHRALRAALDEGDGTVVPLFVLDPRLVGAERMGAPRLRCLVEALSALDEALRGMGGRLVVRRGDPRCAVPDLARACGATRVHCSDDHSPYARARDDAVAERLEAFGATLVRHEGLLVHPPGAIRTGAGSTYKVFTPFHAAWKKRAVSAVLQAPRTLRVPDDIESEVLPDTTELDCDDAPGLPGGEEEARRRLAAFLRSGAEDYHRQRDRLDLDGTSRLSADLHFGCLSPRQVLTRLDQRKPGHATLAAQLAWRDFYTHVLAAWPEVLRRELDESMRNLPWRGEGADLTAWEQGRTGYPIVDAGMRQLLAEGWMHNRARMIVASFLCKDLLIDWRLGEAHFLRHLHDADAASNNGGWQWAAGTGTDAQPWFRIFNPVSQGQRHDPDGDYVRRYVPELAAVPTRWIHRPFAMPDEVATECGVKVGRDYPAPIVDHAEARAEALEWFARHRR